MMSDVTILFCFFCESNSRRKYLDFCIQSIIHSSSKNRYLPILVIDGSSYSHYLKNRELFSSFKNCEIIHDTELNPIVRLDNHLNSIQTEFTLKLLEDCLFLDFNWGETLQVDALLLSTEKENCVVQYPTWPEDQVIAREDTIVCLNRPKSYNLCNKNGIRYYNRIAERDHHNYLCNNILYKTRFLRKHIKHYATICSSHSAAESDRVDKIFSRAILSNSFISKFTKFINKVIFSKKLISKTLISETYKKGAVVHIGYESTEENYFDNPDRKIVSDASSSMHSVLESIRSISHLLNSKNIMVRIQNGKRKYSFDHNLD